MLTYLYRAALKPPMLSLAFLLALSASLFAQQSTVTEPSQSSAPLSTMSTVEVAALNPLPAAPGYETLSPRKPLTPAAAIEIAPVGVQPKLSESHRFWDLDNSLLFTGVAAAATADFFTTHANLASGGRELNPITRVFSGTTPGLATNFALETTGVIGVGYLFHKTGHHKLERMTSVVNIGSSAFAVIYGRTHR